MLRRLQLPWQAPVFRQQEGEGLPGGLLLGLLRPLDGTRRTIVRGAILRCRMVLSWVSETLSSTPCWLARCGGMSHGSGLVV